MKRILSYLRRAVEEYGMIAEGDRVAVGVSGGKDSLALLCAMARFRQFYPKRFELEAITVDMGFPGVDFSEIASLCASLDVPYTVERTQIRQIVFDIRQEENPCALCANLRRGALNRVAVARGCNKTALGHHLDDVVETFVMNLLYEGRVGCFAPVTHLDRTGLRVLRPLIYAPEREITGLARRLSLPVVTSTCPADGNTKRQRVKELLRTLEQENGGVRKRIFHAVKRSADGWRTPEGSENGDG